MNLFRELYAIVRHTPLTLIITPRGEQLSVIVLPKPSGDAQDNPALAAPISAVGTPEELDAQLPEAVRAYAGKVAELRAVLRLPTGELEQAAQVAEKEAERASAKRAQTKTAKKKPPQPVAAAPATTPATTTPQPAPADDKWPFPVTVGQPAEPAARTRKAPAPKPGKAECIADYRTLHAEYGAKLTRRRFIATASTGRRYEKLWKNWETFETEARAQSDERTLPLPLEQAQTNADFLASAPSPQPSPTRGEGETPGEAPSPQPSPTRGEGETPGQAPSPQPSATRGEGDNHRSAAVSGAPDRRPGEGQDPAQTNEPLATPDPDRRPGEGQDPAQTNEPLATTTIEPTPYVDGPPLGSPDAPGWDVFDHTGAYLSSITTEPRLGRQVFLIGHVKGLIVVKVDGKRVTVFNDQPATETA